MITDLYMAALTGGSRSLPFTVPNDPDINAFRAALSIDPAVPCTFNALIRVVGAYPYVLDGLPVPVPPPGVAAPPSITGTGTVFAPAWATGRPPAFVHKPLALPLPTQWTLVRQTATTAGMTNNAGAADVIPCFVSDNDVLVPAWPSWVGSNMGASVPATYWNAGSPVHFNIPPTSYPFAYADSVLTAKPYTMRLLADAAATTLHASLLRPQERCAVVAAAVVKRFVRTLVQVTDGYGGVMYPGLRDPQDPNQYPQDAEANGELQSDLTLYSGSILAYCNQLLSANV